MQTFYKYFIQKVSQLYWIDHDSCILQILQRASQYALYSQNPMPAHTAFTIVSMWCNLQKYSHKICFVLWLIKYEERTWKNKKKWSKYTWNGNYYFTTVGNGWKESFWCTVFALFKKFAHSCLAFHWQINLALYLYLQVRTREYWEAWHMPHRDNWHSTNITFIHYINAISKATTGRFGVAVHIPYLINVTAVAMALTENNRNIMLSACHKKWNKRYIK